MSRPLRIEYPGAVYHVTSWGNEKKPVFRDDQDREGFLNTLHEVNRRYGWICHAYCLMTSHYHLLIETPDGNLALGMRQLNGVYTQRFNRRHGRAGHLFQGRYKAIVIQKDTHLLEVCRYVVLNPVRAKISEKPEEYPWSSHGAAAGKAEPHPCLTTDWVLGQFGRPREKAVKAYRKFVSRGTDEQAVWNDVRGQALLGEKDFVDRLRGRLRMHRDAPEIPRSQRYAHRPTLPALFTDGQRLSPQKRRRTVIKAIEQYGYLQSEIAAYLGIHYSTVSRIVKGER